MSYHDDMNIVIDELIEHEPMRLKVYHDYMVKLKTGYFAEYWVDVIMQTEYHSPLDIYHSAIFAEIWTALNAGWIVHAPIGPIQEPEGDDAEQHNNDTLALLPKPFCAKFSGGHCGDNDGNLRWDEPLYLADSSQPAQPGQPILRKVFSFGSAPLEVGYTRPTTSLRHLMLERCLARWPYGSNKVWLLIVVKDDLWVPDYGLDV